MIRAVRLSDAVAIAAIYNHYVEHTVITFELELVSVEEIQRRMEKITAKYPYLVYEEAGEVVGYAYLSEFRSRVAYSQTAETSVYLHREHGSKGIGSQLYQALIELAVDYRLHVLIGGVTLPNPSSERLHERFGFRKVAHFSEVGRKFDRWLDVGFWELKI